MVFKVLLTLDINKINKAQRDVFYEYLATQNWEKIEKIDTAWKCTFKDGIARLEVLNICKQDVKEASRLANTNLVSSVVQIGQGDVVEF